MSPTTSNLRFPSYLMGIYVFCPTEKGHCLTLSNKPVPPLSSNAFTALWIALLLPLEWSKHASISIALDFSALDILAWSVLKLTLCEPNYKEKEVHWPTDWTNSEPRGAFFELSHRFKQKQNKKKTLSNLIEVEMTGHLRRWEGGTVRYTFFVLCICQYWIESFIRATNVIKYKRY